MVTVLVIEMDEGGRVTSVRTGSDLFHMEKDVSIIEVCDNRVVTSDGVVVMVTEVNKDNEVVANKHVTGFEGVVTKVLWFSPDHLVLTTSSNVYVFDITDSVTEPIFTIISTIKEAIKSVSVDKTDKFIYIVQVGDVLRCKLAQGTISTYTMESLFTEFYDSAFFSNTLGKLFLTKSNDVFCCERDGSDENIIKVRLLLLVF